MENKGFSSKDFDDLHRIYSQNSNSNNNFQHQSPSFENSFLSEVYNNHNSRLENLKNRNNVSDNNLFIGNKIEIDSSIFSDRYGKEKTGKTNVSIIEITNDYIRVYSSDHRKYIDLKPKTLEVIEIYDQNSIIYRNQY